MHRTELSIWQKLTRCNNLNATLWSMRSLNDGTVPETDLLHVSGEATDRFRPDYLYSLMSHF